MNKKEKEQQKKDLIDFKAALLDKFQTIEDQFAFGVRMLKRINKKLDRIPYGETRADFLWKIKTIVAAEIILALELDEVLQLKLRGPVPISEYNKK